MLSDCREGKLCKKWSVNSDVERVLWDHFNPFYFFVAANDGLILNSFFIFFISKFFRFIFQQIMIFFGSFSITSCILQYIF